MKERGEIDSSELELLFKIGQEPPIPSPFDFLNEKTWSNIKHLSSIATFHGLDRDIETSSKRWKKYIENELPELEKPPVDKVSSERISLSYKTLFSI